jgi:hypothetical protein
MSVLRWIVRLVDERARYRAALEAIATYAEVHDATAAGLQNIARGALAAAPEHVVALHGRQH